MSVRLPFNKPLGGTAGGQAGIGAGSTTPDWAKFFGTPKNGAPVPIYDISNHATWNLPDAYVGTNDYIASSIEIHAHTTDTFYTQYLLPITKTDRLGIAWETLVFEPTLADLVPEQGVPRLVTSGRTSGQATLERRGLGLEVEMGFMNTAYGQRHYIAQLKQINQAVIDTNNYRVMIAILSADDDQVNRARQTGRFGKTLIEEALELKKDNWDSFKQNPHAFETLDTIVREQMFSYGGRANTWIVPPKIAQYLARVPSENIDYYKAGPAGPQLLNDSVESFRSFAGNRVYQTRLYDFMGLGPKDVMKLPSQIGEYHLAFDRFRGGNLKHYKSSWRDIEIYNEDNDQMQKFDLSTMLDASYRHNPDTGKLLSIKDPLVSRFAIDFSDKDIKEDFLHFVDSNGTLREAKYMGNSYHDRKDLFDIAQSVIQAMKTLRGKDARSIQSRWALGMDALRAMEHTRFDAELNEFIEALIAANPGPTTTSTTSSVPVPEFKTNAWGSLDFPARSTPWKFGLPPTHLNYAGLKTIAEAVYQGKEHVESLGFSFSWFDKIRDFVELIDEIVVNLKMYFPDSVVLKKEYASPWWSKPESATTLFENLIASHAYPLYAKKGGASGPSRIGVDETDPSAGSSARPSADEDLSEFGSESAAEGSGEAVAETAYEGVPKLARDFKRALKGHMMRERGFQNLRDALTAESSTPLKNAALNQALEEARKDWEEILSDEIPEGMSPQESLESLKKLIPIVILSRIDFKASKSDKTRVLTNIASAYKQMRATYESNDFPTSLRRWAEANPGIFVSSSAPAALASKIRQEFEEKEREFDRYETFDSRADPAEGEEAVEKFLDAAGEFGDDGLKNYARSPLVFGPKMLEEWYEFIKEGNQPVVVLAGLGNPDTTISYEEAKTLKENLESGDRNAQDQDIPYAATRASTLIGNRFTVPTNLACVTNTKLYLSKEERAEHIATLIGAQQGDQYQSGGRSRQQQQQRSIGRLLPQDRETRRWADSQGVSDSDYDRRQRTFAASVGRRSEFDYSRENPRDSDQYGRTYGSMSASRSSFPASDRDRYPTRMPPGREHPRPNTRFTENLEDSISEEIDTEIENVFKTPTMMNQFYSAKKDSDDDLTRIIIQVYLTTPTDKKNYEALIKHNIVFPWNFLLLRPHARYLAYSVVKMLAGTETGSTFVGKSIFTLGDNAQSQKHTGSYTYYSQAVITNPKNIHRIEGVFVDEYNGGLGATVYQPGVHQYDPGNGIYGGDAGDASVFMIALPRYETELPSPFSIDGRFTIFGKKSSDIKNNKTLHYSSAAYYCALWGFSTSHIESAIMSRGNWRGRLDMNPPNNIVYQGTTLYWDPHKGGFNAVRKGTGMWRAEFTYPGCKAAREGKLLAYTPVSYDNWVHV